MVKEGNPETDLKKRLARAAEINSKTVERGAKNLLAVMFGVTEEELAADPALRAYCKFLLTGESPYPYVILTEESSKDST